MKRPYPLRRSPVAYRSLVHAAHGFPFLIALTPLYAQAQEDGGEIVIEEDDVVVADEDEDEDESFLEDEPTASDTDEAVTDEEVVEQDVEAQPEVESEATTQPSEELEQATPSEPTANNLPSKQHAQDPNLAQLAQQSAQAALVDIPSREASLSPLSFTTSTFSRFEYRHGYDELNVARPRYTDGDLFVFRARLGMRTHALPIGDNSDVFLQFSPQASGTWGTNGTVGEANLGIYEGYLNFRTARLDVQLGRMMMDYGDGLVVSDFNWHQAGRAFDGIRSHYKMDKGYFDLFATQVAAGTSGGGKKLFAGDELFWGAYLGMGHYLSSSLDFDAYFLGLSHFAQQDLIDPTSGVSYKMDPAHLFTLGLRAKQKIGVFDYRLEAGLQLGHSIQSPAPGFSGTEVNASRHVAYQVDGEVGADIGTHTRLALGGVLASGDNSSTTTNEGWAELYPNSHKFLGLMDVIGARTNVASGSLKITQRVFESLQAQLDGHVFARLESGGLGSTAGPGLAGTEVDAQLLQALGKYAQVRGLYGLFVPASGQYISDHLVHYLEVEAGLNF